MWSVEIQIALSNRVRPHMQNRDLQPRHGTEGRVTASDQRGRYQCIAMPENDAQFYCQRSSGHGNRRSEGATRHRLHRLPLVGRSSTAVFLLPEKYQHER
jgi:hypothetical protein